MAAPTPVTSRRKSRPEAAACGIGFLASRKGVAERALVDIALGLCRQFDHRGAPGHGAGLLLDIPWPLLLDRFPEQTRVIAQRDAALGMFFLPFDAKERRLCVETVEELATEAGSEVLGWADVPFNVEALPPGSAARRTAPVVRQALFKRPAGLGEDGWFASPLPAAPGPRRDPERDGGRQLRHLQPVQPHGGLPRPGRAVPGGRPLSRPPPRALRLALRALPQPLLHQHHHRLAPRPALLVPRPQRRDRHHPGQHGLDARHRPGPRAEDRGPAARPPAHGRAGQVGGLRGRIRQREPRRHDDRAHGRRPVDAAVPPGPPARGPARPPARAHALGLPRGHERAARGLRRAGRHRGLRRRRGGGPSRPQRPAAPLDHHHPRLRPRGQRAHGHRRSRPRRDAAHLRPRRHGRGPALHRGGAAHGGRPARGLGPALPDPEGTGRGPLLRRAGRGAGRAGSSAGRLRHDEGRPRRGPGLPGQGGEARHRLHGRRHAARRHARPPPAPARGPLQAAFRPGDVAPHRSHPRRLGLRERRGPRRSVRPVGRGAGAALCLPPPHPFRRRAVLAERPGPGPGPRRHVPRGPGAGGPGAGPRGRAGRGAGPGAGQRGAGPVRPRGERGARAPPGPAAGVAPPRRDREGRLPPQGWPGGRLRGLGRAPLRLARVHGRRRRLPLAGQPDRRRSGRELPEGPAHGLRGSDVDDRGDPLVGLLRRQAGGGRGPGAVVPGGRVPRGGGPPGRPRQGRPRPRLAGVPHPGLRARDPRTPGRGRVPLPSGRPAALQRSRGGARRSTKPRATRRRPACTLPGPPRPTPSTAPSCRAGSPSPSSTCSA